MVIVCFKSAFSLKHLNRSATGAMELFDLSVDPSEDHNIASAHPDIVRELEALMKEAHTDSDLYPINPCSNEC